MSAAPFLCVNNAIHMVGRFTLGQLSLSLPARDWCVLLGPSGSGKTTLLNLLAGVCSAPPGVVTMDGRDIGHLPPERRRIAYISQHGDLFPHLTVAQNVAFGLRFLRLSVAEKERRVGRLLEMFGIEALAAQRAETVSGGEGRRVALARGLAIDPVLLLLDEPLGMLDPPARRTMQAALATAHENLGTTTLHVTHDLQEARALGRQPLGKPWCCRHSLYRHYFTTDPATHPKNKQLRLLITQAQ